MTGSTAPLIQYITNRFPWWNTELINEELIIYTNIIILIFFITYISFKKIFQSSTYHKVKHYKFKNIDIILNLGFYFSLFCGLYIIIKTGLINLFARSTNNLDIENGSFSLIISNVFTSFPIITSSIHIIYKRNYGFYQNKWKFLIVLLIGIIINFPTGIARNKLAVIYIGLLLLLLKPYYKNKFFIKYLVLFGLLFAFPLVNIFRNNDFNDLNYIQISLPDPTQDFIEGDFDSYSMLSRSIYYFHTTEVNYGRQILGNILFFVPRSIWSEKPVGSGYTIAKDLGWQFANVSCPYIGEGYINFGIIGVLFFAILMAYIVNKCDRKYKNGLVHNKTTISLISIIYPFLLGFIVFILRGDLLSSLSFTIGFLFPAWLFMLIDIFISLICK